MVGPSAAPRRAIPNPRLVFFAGKGGVGKTTCASAFALAALRRDKTAGRVLLVSTDPAHSLGDALGVRLSSAPRTVVRTLDAMELNAPRAFQRWLTEHRRPLGDVIEHGTWLDRDDVDALLDLSIPGIDELVGMLEIGRFAASLYDLIVVDTAPTGHTLRLLAAPESVAAVAEVLDALQEQHRVIRDQLARVGRPEASDRLIVLLAEQARETARRLHDPETTTFHWVTLPEELARAESIDGIAALEAGGMRVSEVVINRVLPEAGPCRLCDRRRADERRVIAAIRRQLGRGRLVSVVEASVREPRGLRALAALAPVMADGSWLRAHGSGLMEKRTIHHRPSVLGPQPSALDRITGAASLLFFGGKGGVGKTSVSAAAALWLARSDANRRVLLLSTDPAHSLGDVFQATVGDTARPIANGPDNLAVRELDAARALALRRTAFEAALDEIASAFGAGAATGSGGASGLMSLAPPGVDELFGVLSVVDARADFDVIVVDTAPTGHALRLLEMPDVAREWMQALLRVLLKYKSLVRPGQLAAELVELSKSIRDLQALLRDPARTRFIVVTRPAEVPRVETSRLIAQLRRLRLSAPAIVVNALTIGPGRCAWCRATAAAERRELDALRRLCGRRCAMIQTPLVAPPPRGVKQLNAWAEQWLASSRSPRVLWER
jgi:arsenite-transporting ATPase